MATYSFAEEFAVIFVGVVLLVPLVMALLFGLFTGVAMLLNDALNLDSRVSKPGRKLAAQFFGTIFLVILGVGIFALPIIG
jgi:succinate dehydrogenase/fumarate reductase cytochrome b subunit